MQRTPLRPRPIATPASTADGTVGYRNPPRHTRFRKGQSGNPTGRRNGTKNLKSIVVDSANEPVTVKEGGRRRTVTKLEAMAKALADKAAAGDPRATQQLTQLLQIFEGRSEQPVPPPALGEADELVVQQLYFRVAAMIKGTTDEDPNTR
jgi:Family of unknown function (DUF5681)